MFNRSASVSAVSSAMGHGLHPTCSEENLNEALSFSNGITTLDLNSKKRPVGNYPPPEDHFSPEELVAKKRANESRFSIF